MNINHLLKQCESACDCVRVLEECSNAEWLAICTSTTVIGSKMRENLTQYINELMSDDVDILMSEIRGVSYSFSLFSSSWMSILDYEEFYSSLCELSWYDSRLDECFSHCQDVRYEDENYNISDEFYVACDACRDAIVESNKEIIARYEQAMSGIWRNELNEELNEIISSLREVIEYDINVNINL